MDTHRATEPTQAEEPSRGRRIGFRVVVTIVGLWFLAWHIFGLSEIVLMWLPAETLGGILGDGGVDMSLAELEAHRSHFMIIGLVTWALVLSVFAQWRKPERRLGSMLLVIVLAVGAGLVYALSGTFQEWLLEELMFVMIPVGLVAALHPRRGDLFKRSVHDPTMLKVALAGTVPWLIYTFDNARLQIANSTDIHGVDEHWAVAALLGIVIVAASLIGSSKRDGWKLPAWYGALCPVVFGIHSLVFPDRASGLTHLWAVAAIVWGLVFAMTIAQRSRDVQPAAG